MRDCSTHDRREHALLEQAPQVVSAQRRQPPREVPRAIAVVRNAFGVDRIVGRIMACVPPF